MINSTRSRGVLLSCAVLALLLNGRGAVAQGAPSEPSPSVIPAWRLAFYAYDRDLALNAKLKPLDSNEKRTRYLLDYTSVHDQTVTAIVAVPKGFRGPYPAVILVHGSGGDKDTSYIKYSSELLTGIGYITLAIDTQYHGDRRRADRSGDIHMPDSYTMRDAWVQSVVDLRRAVDYLQTRSDIDAKKIGYLGFSQGGMLGSVLGGVEPRIAAFCLAVPGGGFVELFRHIDDYPFLKSHAPTMTPEVLQRVEDISAVTDPIYYVGGIAPRPLLILLANHDEIIPPLMYKALLDASHARPDQIKRWESGHVLNLMAIFDVKRFFEKSFGERPRAAARHRVPQRTHRLGTAGTKPGRRGNSRSRCS